MSKTKTQKNVTEVSLAQTDNGLPNSTQPPEHDNNYSPQIIIINNTLVDILWTLSKLILIVLILAYGTGPHIRHLFSQTFRHLVALVVGSLWFIGDFLSLAAFVKLFNDILSLPYGLAASLKRNAIIQIFVFLSASELIVQSLWSGKINSDRSRKYANVLFHIQLYLSLVNLLKPWQWNDVDLRKILQRFERLHSLSLRSIRGLLSLLNNNKSKSVSTPDNIDLASARIESQPLNNQLTSIVNEDTTAVASSSSASPINRRSTDVHESTSQRLTRPPSSKRQSRAASRSRSSQSATGSALTERGTRNRSAGSTRSRRDNSTSATRSSTLSSRQPFVQSISVTRRSAPRRGATIAASHSRVGVPRGRARRGIGTISVIDEPGSRTVNLNLNVN